MKHHDLVTCECSETQQPAASTMFSTAVAVPAAWRHLLLHGLRIVVVMHLHKLRVVC